MSMNAHQGVIPPWTAEDRLVKARQYAGLTQVELAHLLDVSDKTIKRYEAGDKAKRGVLLGWAMVCGVNATWLETGHYPPDTGPGLESATSTCIPLDAARSRRRTDRAIPRQSRKSA